MVNKWCKQLYQGVQWHRNSQAELPRFRSSLLHGISFQAYQLIREHRAQHTHGFDNKSSLGHDWLQEVTLYETTDGRSHLQRLFGFEVLSLKQNNHVFCDFSHTTRSVPEWPRHWSLHTHCFSLAQQVDPLDVWALYTEMIVVYDFSVLPVSLVQTGNYSEWRARTRSEYDFLSTQIWNNKLICRSSYDWLQSLIIQIKLLRLDSN